MRKDPHQRSRLGIVCARERHLLLLPRPELSGLSRLSPKLEASYPRFKGRDEQPGRDVVHVAVARLPGNSSGVSGISRRVRGSINQGPGWNPGCMLQVIAIGDLVDR